MANVTPLKAGNPTKPLGEFKIERFSMFDDDDLAKYAELKNKANNPANGIKFELLREFSRKTTTVEGDGDSRVATTTEEIILVVHYWENPRTRQKVDSNEDLEEGKAVLVPAAGRIR